MVENKGVGSIVIKVAIYTLLAITAIACLLPLINTLAISFSNASEAASGMVGLWPLKPTTSSYKKLLTDADFWRAFGVSVKRVLIGTALSMAVTILMAYPLSREPRMFPGRNIYMWILVFTMLFSGGLVAWYLVISKLGILNSIWALTLPHAVNSFNVILMANFFRGIPKEMEEAAVVDGAGAWRTLTMIVLPVSTPVLATILLFNAVFLWNEYFNGMILVGMDKAPLMTYIQQLQVQLNTMGQLSAEEIKMLTESSNKTLNSTKIIVAMVPILLLYPFLQKYFVHGIVMGSVKE